MRLQFWLFLLLTNFFLGEINAQDAKKEEVKWIGFEEALNLQTTSKKPIMVFVYTNWCSWCKLMEKDIFQNPKAVSYLNDQFYSVKINAESKDTFVVKGQTYTYLPQYKANELALYLLEGRLSFPTTVFLTATQKMQRIPSYLDLMHAEWLYRFFGEQVYEKSSFDDYMKTHKPTW
ncbi:thioredoxin family protein [Gynurincola endophyticus]|jgi:thioredoxin-related protein|uniref:thioredoxin family protein n=1 Tax=Gynurincola endophyticus TaxID=2479004 RepID=UPI000F8D5C06|nr:DUF255 domain-containing protein [Gynurincola endophyticus]